MKQQLQLFLIQQFIVGPTVFGIIFISAVTKQKNDKSLSNKNITKSIAQDINDVFFLPFDLTNFREY